MSKPNPAPLITIPAVTAGIAAKHRAIIDVCRSPEFSLEKLREVVRKNQI